MDLLVQLADLIDLCLNLELVDRQLIAEAVADDLRTVAVGAEPTRLAALYLLATQAA